MNNCLFSCSSFRCRNNVQDEKQQLIELNNRLASYIERVRYLEEQNRYIQDELDCLRLDTMTNEPCQIDRR
jgi:hypothetical protein